MGFSALLMKEFYKGPLITNKYIYLFFRNAIINEIIELRTKGLNCSEGIVKCIIRELNPQERNGIADCKAVIDFFCVSDLSLDDASTYNKMKHQWVEVDNATANKIILLALTENFGLVSERIPANKAVYLADAFLNCFLPNVRYFTNGEYRFKDNNNHSALTYFQLYGSIEYGIICLDEKSIGILWTKDDD
jgi:hypothetical protein